jgi:uncharacterized protein YabN with tetrapyrrole methylase and pyrophosphatase domain
MENPTNPTGPALTALQQALHIGAQTKKLGFDWENKNDVLLKVHEELSELEQAIKLESVTELKHEIGDLLFSICQLARHHEIDPEKALTEMNQRFCLRFETMQSLCKDRQLNWDALTNFEKENLWTEAKNKTRGL